MRAASCIIAITLSILWVCLAGENATAPEDFPANPVAKPGWILVVNDEFDGPELKETLWMPEYFPKRYPTPMKAEYYFKDGAIHIHANGPKVRPEGDQYQAVSSLQTFNCHNLHKQYHFGPEEVPTVNNFSQLYGWYEIRAKHVGPMHHIAFWALEAKPGGSEIDVTEDPAWTGPNWHKINSKVPFPRKRKKINGGYDQVTTKRQRASGFHIYALEIFPGGSRIYHDNKLIEETEVDWTERGDTPLMFFLGIYGSKSPKDFEEKQEYVVDYFRAYKREQDKTPQNKADSDK